MELENSASQDAVVREKIANLPAEVQDVSLLDKIEGIQHTVYMLVWSLKSLSAAAYSTT